MNKIYKGYELIKAIEERKIKENSLFKNELGTYICLGETLWYYNTLHKTKTEEVGNSMMINNTFELIEDEIDIDIQSIEEFRTEYIMDNVEFQLQDKINQILLAVKQLGKKMNSN